MSGAPDDQPKKGFHLRTHIIKRAPDGPGYFWTEFDGWILEEKLEGVSQVVVEGGQHLLVESQCVQLVDSWREDATIILPFRGIN